MIIQSCQYKILSTKNHERLQQANCHICYIYIGNRIILGFILFYLHENNFSYSIPLGLLELELP